MNEEKVKFFTWKRLSYCFILGAIVGLFSRDLITTIGGFFGALLGSFIMFKLK